MRSSMYCSRFLSLASFMIVMRAGRGRVRWPRSSVSMSSKDVFRAMVLRSGGGESSNKNEVLGFCLKCDVKHYFETVDHVALLDILRRRIKDQTVMSLVRV